MVSKIKTLNFSIKTAADTRKLCMRASRLNHLLL